MLLRSLPQSRLTSPLRQLDFILSYLLWDILLAVVPYFSFILHCFSSLLYHSLQQMCMVYYLYFSIILFYVPLTSQLVNTGVLKAQPTSVHSLSGVILSSPVASKTIQILTESKCVFTRDLPPNSSVIF